MGLRLRSVPLLSEKLTGFSFERCVGPGTCQVRRVVCVVLLGDRSDRSRSEVWSRTHGERREVGLPPGFEFVDVFSAPEAAEAVGGADLASAAAEVRGLMWSRGLLIKVLQC